MVYSSSWEYLIDMVLKNEEIVTILPLSTYRLMDQDLIIHRPFTKPLAFDIYLSRRSYEAYPESQDQLFDWIQSYCKRQLTD